MKTDGLFSAMVQKLEPDIYNKVKKEYEEKDAKSHHVTGKITIDTSKYHDNMNDLSSLLEFLG